MIDYGKFQFACAPRVGVSWFVKACQLAGLGPAFVRTHRPTPHNGKHRVSLVRHPVGWLESIYAARRVGWGSDFLGKLSHLDTLQQPLEGFIWQYLEMPGEVGKLMLAYEADVILRIEDVPEAFLSLLSPMGIGEEFFRGIRNLGRTHVNPLHPQVGMAQRKRIMESEKELCDGFNYF